MPEHEAETPAGRSASAESRRDRPAADEPRDGYLSLAYIGNRRIPAPVLQQMWSRGQWRYPCPAGCGGTLYIHALGGSPLSGRGAMNGRCTRCGEMRLERGSTPWSGDVLHDGLENAEPEVPRDPRPGMSLVVGLLRSGQKPLPPCRRRNPGKDYTRDVDV